MVEKFTRRDTDRGIRFSGYSFINFNSLTIVYNQSGNCNNTIFQTIWSEGNWGWEILFEAIVLSIMSIFLRHLISRPQNDLIHLHVFKIQVLIRSSLPL